MQDAYMLFLHALALRLGGRVTITEEELENARHRAHIVDRTDDNRAIIFDVGPKVLAVQVAEQINEKGWK